jgi:prevent-host-death family protein
MARKTIGIRALKDSVSRVIDEVAERKEEYVVTERGKPVAVLRPWSEEDQEAERRLRVEAVLARMEELAARVAAESAASGNTLTAEEAVSQQRR